MNEIELINVIKDCIKSEFIGDDCAYLKEFGIVISQDSLVENVHFKRDWCTPYQLGYKSVIVNISDILASGAEPKYLTIALSLPNDINKHYVQEFYEGAKSALNGAEIIGGDITGSKSDIIISVTAIGDSRGRNISSRKFAKDGYSIITHGFYGSSAKGLQALINSEFNSEFIKYHLEPTLCPEFSDYISKNITEPYAMMDTSDGLADAIFKIAEASNVRINIDFDKIPHKLGVTKEQILFGGEDYNLIAAIPSNYVSLIPYAVEIGSVQTYDDIRADISGEIFNNYNQLKVYNHFGV